MEENPERNGIELFFPGPLSLQLSRKLRERGWRFARRGKPRWYTKFTEPQWAFGEQIINSFNPATDLQPSKVIAPNFTPAQTQLAKAA